MLGKSTFRPEAPARQNLGFGVKSDRIRGI